MGGSRRDQGQSQDLLVDTRNEGSHEAKDGGLQRLVCWGVCRSSGKLSESSGKGKKLRRPTAKVDWRCTCVLEGAL